MSVQRFSISLCAGIIAINYISATKKASANTARRSTTIPDRSRCAICPIAQKQDLFRMFPHFSYLSWDITICKKFPNLVQLNFLIQLSPVHRTFCAPFSGATELPRHVCRRRQLPLQKSRMKAIFIFVCAFYTFSATLDFIHSRCTTG